MNMQSGGRIAAAPRNGRPRENESRASTLRRDVLDDSLERLYSRSLRLLCVVGFDGYVKQSNPVWDAVLGYTRDEIMSLQIRDLVHPDDLARMADVRRQLIDNQCTLGVEVRVRLKDGSYHWIIWNAAPCVEENIFFVTAHDMTERKRIEEELQESQARLGLLASATNEAVWDWDARTGRVWRNKEFIETFGGSEMIEGDPLAWWCERIHPDDRARVAAYRPAVADGRERWKLEYRMRRLDGTYAHVYDRGFVIVDPDGKPARMVGSLMDISALKKTEERLRESEDHFRLVVKATRDAIWDWDLRTGQVWRSDGFQTFGYRRKDMSDELGWWIERIHPADRARVLAHFARPNRGDLPQRTCEYRFRRADGTYADVFDRGYVMFSPHGEPVRMLGALMDISERHRAEEVAHMQRAELAHDARVRTLGEIATGVAHELNQPLTAIGNYAESCLHTISGQELENREKLLTWLEQIVNNTERAGDMIRRLRRFVRKSEPRHSAVDINELVREVIDLLQAEARLQNVRVRWHKIAATHATLDRVQVQQVLVNLLRNAFEAMADNATDRRQVVIKATQSADEIEISVEDLGMGVAAEDANRVFEAFFTTKPNGLGIGLAISRSIIEDHGGRLWVDSRRRRGAVFRFTLPLEGTTHAAVAGGSGRR